MYIKYKYIPTDIRRDVSGNISTENKKGGLKRPPIYYMIIQKLSNDDFLDVAALFVAQMEEVNAFGKIVHINLVHLRTAGMVELVNIDSFAHHVHHLGVELLSFIGSYFNIHERGGRVRIDVDFRIVKFIDAGDMTVIL